MKKYFIISALLFIVTAVKAQTAGVVSNFASLQSRQQLRKKLIDTAIYQYLALPPADSTEGEWNHAFWAIELLAYKNDFIKQRLHAAWQQADSLSEFFLKNLLEAVYSVYPEEFVHPVDNLLHTTNSARVFVRCAEYLLRADKTNTRENEIQQLLKLKFNNSDDVAITILQRRLNTLHDKIVLPAINDLLNKNFLKNKCVIYCFERKNRDYPGLVVIRKPDGTFAKDEKNIFFHTAQLARAVTNYPFYITNGNTPQGILRWTGFEVSKNNYIGPTLNLQLVLPYEVSPEIFFNDSTLRNTEWSTDLYTSLLPETWKYYDGMYESFFAGAMGRNAIIMHGTTIDPSYYKGQNYYPQTPSLGCLCSYEEWDKNGNRIKSNQQQIVDELDTIECNEGYVVVIELDDEKKPVVLNDVVNFLNAAEISSK